MLGSHTFGALAQNENEVSTSLKADVVSSYIWRGLQLAHASVQPEMSVGWNGLSLSAWGNVGLTNHEDDVREIDLTLSYETGGFSVGVCDYWTDEYDERYFYYRKENTGHAFEGFLGYDFGPVAVAWQTIFAGQDYQEEDGKRAYSSYLQVSAPFRWVACDWEATAGLVPWASDYYGTTGFSVSYVSLRATKDISIADKFTLPLFGQLVANPGSQHFYFVFGLTLNVL